MNPPPRVVVAALVLAAVALFAPLAATHVHAQVASEPPIALPTLPDTTATDIVIEDLELAPPLAREPILELVLLGAYPLTDDMLALPNELLDPRTAAYMLVNVFALGVVDQFPVPPDQALVELEVLTGIPPGTDVVTVGQMSDYILTFARLLGAELPALSQALVDRYPALAAGNLEAPMTRAGGALMIVIALEHLTAPPV